MKCVGSYNNCLLELFRLILLPALFFLFATPSGFAANISIYDSVEKSLRHDPRIKSLAYRIEAAEFDLKRERSLYLPKIDMAIGYGLEQYSDKGTRRSGARPSDSDWDPLVDASLRITQRIYDGGGVRQRVSIQQSVLDVAGLKHQGIRNFVILDTINAHLNVLRHREVEALATRNLEAHQHIIQQLKEREQAGAGSIADVAQAQARYSQARATWLIVQKDLQHAQATYYRLTDSGPAPEHFGYQSCHDVFPATLEQTLDLAKSLNPELKVADLSLIEAEAQEKLSRSAYKPKVDLQLSSRYNDQLEGDPSWKNTNDIMLKLNWNLFDGGHTRAVTAAAMARRNQVRADRENLLLELYEQTTVTWSTYRSLEEHRKILDDAISYSYLALDSYMQQFSVSQRSLLELLDAQNNYFQTATQLINVSVNRDLAGYELLGLIGDINISQCLTSDNTDPFGLYQLHGISTKTTKKPSEYEHTTEKQKDAPQRSVDAMASSAVENEDNPEDSSSREILRERSLATTQVSHYQPVLTVVEEPENLFRHEVSAEGSLLDHDQEMPPVTPHGTHSVQLASMSLLANAEIYLKNMLDKGYPAHIVTVDLVERGVWYRLQIGPFKNSAAAKSAKKVLLEKEFIEAMIIRHAQ